MKNPRFENYMKKNEMIQKSNQIDVNKRSQKDVDRIKKIIQKKFALQWTTLQKAFRDLNIEKDGLIKDYELKYVFEHWGLNLSPDQF